MHAIIEHLNTWGPLAVSLGWHILWQSSLLIALMLLLDLGLGRKLRPGLHYLLWLVVLLKLVLPPSLALPSGLAWWVRPQGQTPHRQRPAPMVVTYGPISSPLSPAIIEAPSKSAPSFSPTGFLLVGVTIVSLGFLAGMLWRWRQVALQTRPENCSAAPDWLSALLEEACTTTGVRRRVGLRIVPSAISPAVFGLVRPVVVLPESLLHHLSAGRLRAVLLHELIHLRRGDVWVNCAQALLQIVYWWHPLVWVANQRLRRVREEAVDEAVMLALRGEAEGYAPTLLEVARLALPRRSAGLGLVGILESHSALRQRIERLVDFHPPRKAGLSFTSVACAAVFGLTALPMGRAPAASTQDQLSQTPSQTPAEAEPIKAKKAEVQALLQDGKSLYEMGKTQEAEKKFLQVLQQDPSEQTAYYYLNLIRETKSKQQRPNSRTTSAGWLAIFKKLDSLRLDNAEFDGVPLSAVLKSLSTESQRLDPAGTGINFILNPSPADSTQTPPLADVRIQLAPSLTNIRMADLLDAIVKTAERRIKYSLEDYAVVFSEKGNEPTPLYTRVITVDPKTFEAALRSLPGQPESAAKFDAGKMLREFLASINVDLAPPKTIFWSDRSGTLMVRATLQDLDTIETAIQVLNATPPQLNLKAEFFKIPEQQETAFWEQHHDTRRSSSGFRVLQLSSTEVQTQLIAWKLDGTIEIVGQASVTTLSGRQASIEVQELATVTVTNSPEPHWVTNDIPVGPELQVLPTVSADYLRVDLVMTATLREFLGYGNSTTVPADPNSSSAPSGPLPRFRSRELPITETVWDGQTLIFGGALEDSPASDPGANDNKRLLVMVTASLIDAAGNRLHTDGEVERRVKKLGGR